MTLSSIPTSTTLKIVVDTNQFLSVFVFRGKLMKLVFELVIYKKINLYISPALRSEVLRKLLYFGVSKQVRDDVMSFVDEKGILVIPTVKVDVCRDREDNFILELAESSQADYIVTRDKDLLDLADQRWKETKIVKPEDFLPLLRKMKLLE